MSKDKRKTCYSGIGGQAVLEGIMMRNKDTYAVAVRKPDGEIVVDKQTSKGLSRFGKVATLPFVRGVFSFIDSMVIGVKTLTYSAQFYDDEAIEPTKFEKWLDNKLGEKGEKVVIGLTVAFSVVLAIAVFMLLPLFLSDMLVRFVPFLGEESVPAIEGVLKLIIFIGYLLLISFMKDIKRTFMYHGSEHKCINCIENGFELTTDNVMKSSRYHKRCGTSFLLIVMIISIAMFMLIRVDTVWLKYVIRILLIPVIAGVSYEFLRLAGRSNNPVVNILSKPGLMLQHITTKEPTEDMVEVAIKAVEEVFDWKAYLESNEESVCQSEN